MVPVDGVVGEPAQEGDIPGRPGVLEAAHPEVAAGHSGEHGSRQHGLATHRASGRHDCQGAGGGYAERVHRLADDVLAQHRSDGGQAVAPSRERSAPGTLQVQISQPAVGVDDLAEEEGAAVAESRCVAAELVTGVGLRHRGGAVGDEVADQQAQALGGLQRVAVQTELGGQRFVEDQQLWVWRLRGLPGHSHLRELPRETVAEDDSRWGCDAHPAQTTGVLVAIA
jgi:hypothetical protein